MPFICVVSDFLRDKMSFYATTKQWLSNVIALVHVVFNCFLQRLGKSKTYYSKKEGFGN